MTLEQIHAKRKDAHDNRNWYERNAWIRLLVVKRYAMEAEESREYALEAYSHYGINPPTLPTYEPQFQFGGSRPSDDSYVPIPFIKAIRVIPSNTQGYLSYKWDGRLKLVSNDGKGYRFYVHARFVNKSGNLVHENNRVGFTDKIMKITDPNDSVFGGITYAIDRNAPGGGFTVKFHHRIGMAGATSDIVVYEFDSTGNVTSITIEQ